MIIEGENITRKVKAHFQNKDGDFIAPLNSYCICECCGRVFIIDFVGEDEDYWFNVENGKLVCKKCCNSSKVQALQNILQ